MTVPDDVDRRHPRFVPEPTAEGDLLHFRPVRRHLVLLAAASALVVACSGDDDDDQAAAGTEAPARTDAAEGAGGGYCEALAAAEAVSAEHESILESGDATPEQIEAAYNDFNAVLDPALESAPEEIATDLELVLGKTREFIDAIAAADYDLEAMGQDPANEALAAELQSAEFAAASDRVDAYGEEHCGITVGD